jgi:CBS domain-containing protein
VENVTMTDRELSYIVKDQKPLVLPGDETVREACHCMWERRSGSVLVVDKTRCLIGIFTGRDAMRLLAKDEDAAGAALYNAMTRDPVTITPKSRAMDALRAMAEGNFRHIPVLAEGAIKGVVSRGDFKGMELEEYCWQQCGPPKGSARIFRALADVLTRALVVPEDATVQHACRRMWERKCGCSLVVDSGQRLAGIFTGRDALRVLARAKGAAATQVREAMTKDPMTLAPQGTAIDALRIMNEGGFRHLPVVDNGKIVGVVSRNDFTGIEIDRLDEEEHLKEVIW